MKTKQLFLLILTVLIFLRHLPLQAQVLQRLTDKITEKVDQRLDQKTDEAIDKALNDTEEKLDPQETTNPGDPNIEEAAISKGTHGDCSGYYLLMDQGLIQMTTYDKAGKPALILNYTIVETHSLPNGKETISKMEAFDEDGKKISTGTTTSKCINGTLLLDLHATMPYQGQETDGQMQAQGKAQAFLRYPPQLSTGQKLPDATFHLQMKQQQSFITSATFSVKNRKVGGQETITTPAGSWPCYRISYIASIRVLAIRFHYQVTEWYAPGFGIVKSQSRNKKGEVVSFSQLTKVPHHDK